jgi:Spy/CpxP family protein refolding chaperone
MNIFSQQKWLIRLVIVLVTLNIGAMCFILWQHKNNKPTPATQVPIVQKQEEKDNRPPKKSVEELSQILKQELELTPEQEEKFKAIRQDFFDKEQQVRKKLNAGRDSLNEEMFSNSIDTNLAKQIARGIAENEYQIELYRLAQAQQLAKICTPQQLNKFQDLVKEMRDYFRPNKKKQ